LKCPDYVDRSQRSSLAPVIASPVTVATSQNPFWDGDQKKRANFEKVGHQQIRCFCSFSGEPLKNGPLQEQAPLAFEIYVAIINK
jgi:hypothetical protein